MMDRDTWEECESSEAPTMGGMSHLSTSTRLACCGALSAHVDAVMAAEQVCEKAGTALGAEPPDLVSLFVSGEHAQELAPIAEVVRRTLRPGTLIGVTGEGVLGEGEEIERRNGVSLFAASMPGTRLHPFTYQGLPHAKDERDLEGLSRVAEAIGASGGTGGVRGVMLFVDPFSVPTASAVSMLASTARVLEGVRRIPVIGGMASASTVPQNNLLLLDDVIMRTGGVGVTISGDVSLDVMVSQGCRPIGSPLVVTSGRRNVIRELGGRRALDVVRELVEGLDEESRRLIANGMFLGRVVNEYKERFGRGDFLIRAVLGVEQESGAIVVGDSVRVGQTVQFHVRDAETAHEDLRLLLAAQQLQTPPLGGLLFTCNGRGTRLFQEPHHDAQTVSQTLKGDDGSPMPVAGFFCAGEIGPIGNHSFVHGHTATLAMIRERRRGVFDGE